MAALPSHGRGHWFDPSTAHQIKQRLSSQRPRFQITVWNLVWNYLPVDSWLQQQ